VMRIVAFITQTAVIDQILTHLRARAAPAAHAARSPPIDPGPREPEHGTRRMPGRRRPDSHLRTRLRPPATTRGPLACAAVPPRRHRRLRRPWPPPRTAAGAALTAPGREAGHAADSHAVRARSAIAPYVRRMVD
jgi:hypothetical protein